MNHEDLNRLNYVSIYTDTTLGLQLTDGASDLTHSWFVRAVLEKAAEVDIRVAYERTQSASGYFVLLAITFSEWKGLARGHSCGYGKLQSRIRHELLHNCGRNSRSS